MNPGELNRQITLQRVETIPDGAGGTLRTAWIPIGVCFAKVEPEKAGRRFRHNQIISDGWGHLITTYYLAIEPTVRMRVILDNSEILYVHSIVNKGYQNKWMELHCYADAIN